MKSFTNRSRQTSPTSPLDGIDIKLVLPYMVSPQEYPSFQVLTALADQHRLILNEPVPVIVF